MHWAKRRVANARYSLGTSGVSEPPEAGALVLHAQAKLATPFASPENYYGIPALREAIAAAYDAPPEGVLVSDGTSLANYTALAVLCGRGDRVIVESPTYPALLEIPRWLGASVEPWPRNPKDSWIPSIEELERTLASGGPVRLVVLSRLHNPTGSDLPRPFLERLAALAASHDFHVLLDEVYLDFVEGAAPGHTFGPPMVTTGSLTKAFGFGGLRVGWVLGEPQVIAAMRELSFYLSVDGATTAQRVAVEVLAQRERFLTRSRAIARDGIERVQRWIDSRDDVSWTPPDGGLLGWVKLHHIEDTRRFAERLFEEEGVAIAEGDFFGWPGWTRLAFGAPPARVDEALLRLGRALDRA